MLHINFEIINFEIINFVTEPIHSHMHMEAWPRENMSLCTWTHGHVHVDTQPHACGYKANEYTRDMIHIPFEAD